MNERVSEAFVAGVLAAEFETVFRAEVAYVTSDQNQRDMNLLRLPFGLLLEAASLIKSGALEQLTPNSRAILVGAKDFRRPSGPTGLGFVRATQCTVLVYGDPGAPDLEDVFGAPPIRSPSRGFIWERTVPPAEGRPESHAYFARPTDDFLVVCNALAELDTVVKNLTTRDADSAASMQTPELASLLKQRYWAYRRYRHESAIDPVAAGTDAVTKSAQSLTFYLDSELRSGTLRLVATDEAAANALTESLAHIQLKMETATTPNGHASEATFSRDDSELSAERVFNVLGMFGFGIYL